MVAHSRREREALEHVLRGLLWHGKTEEALGVLPGVTPRNACALKELMGCLQKRQSEIIDYARRALTRKIWFESGK